MADDGPVSGGGYIGGQIGVGPVGESLTYESVGSEAGNVEAMITYDGMALDFNYNVLTG